MTAAVAAAAEAAARAQHTPAGKQVEMLKFLLLELWVMKTGINGLHRKEVICRSVCLEGK